MLKKDSQARARDVAPATHAQMLQPEAVLRERRLQIGVCDALLDIARIQELQPGAARHCIQAERRDKVAAAHVQVLQGRAVRRGRLEPRIGDEGAVHVQVPQSRAMPGQCIQGYICDPAHSGIVVVARALALGADLVGVDAGNVQILQRSAVQSYCLHTHVRDFPAAAYVQVLQRGAVLRDRRQTHVRDLAAAQVQNLQAVDEATAGHIWQHR
mmetsp:Transcript_23997/g.65434  ORF Transcript_23997/g.65434 Transcript_23997/m.65434 type:complete len:213 (+) Transcript_23997:226-864(+)